MSEYSLRGHVRLYAFANTSKELTSKQYRIRFRRIKKVRAIFNKSDREYAIFQAMTFLRIVSFTLPAATYIEFCRIIAQHLLGDRKRYYDISNKINRALGVREDFSPFYRRGWDDEAGEFVLDVYKWSKKNPNSGYFSIDVIGLPTDGPIEENQVAALGTILVSMLPGLVFDAIVSLLSDGDEDSERKVKAALWQMFDDGDRKRGCELWQE